MTPEIIHPVVNLNGTSRQELISQRCNVMNSLRTALNRIREMSPNGRDYHMVEGLMVKATAQHVRRYRIIDDLMTEIEAEAEQLSTI